MRIPGEEKRKAASSSRSVPPGCHFAWAGSLDGMKWYSKSVESPDFEKPDIRGFSPLQYASSAGDKRLLSFLLEKGVDGDYQDKQLNTALHHAVMRASLATIITLIDHGASLNKQNDKGQTALHIACAKGLNKIAAALIKSGAKVNICDKEGHTPLHLACADGQIELVRLLLARGVHMNVGDESGETALHYAVRESKLPVVKTLLTKRDRLLIDATNSDGESPLHLACSFGELEIVHCLCEAGASITLLNDFDCTAIQEAFQSSNVKIVEYLRKVHASRGVPIPSLAIKDKPTPMEIDDSTPDGPGSALFNMSFSPFEGTKRAGFS